MQPCRIQRKAIDILLMIFLAFGAICIWQTDDIQLLRWAATCGVLGMLVPHCLDFLSETMK